MTHSIEPSHLSQTTLDRIAEEFATAIRSCQAPSVSDFLDRYPDPSGRLEQLLSSIAMIEGLKKMHGPDGGGLPEVPALVGGQLDDYKILREIGRGGMGVVFEAIHHSLGRRVAIKVLPNARFHESKQVARFRIEARAAARLRHTNIVPVFGVGHSQDIHYYVMDFIDGVSLREWLRRRPLQMESAEPLTQPDTEDSRVRGNAAETKDYFRWVAQVGTKVCDALEYAHSCGVLHRDIKPANLLIDHRGEVWIADFGLAKLSEASELTRTGDVLGTPQYMPPESFDGVYDERSEVYAVALTLYELLTLRPAIEGKNAADTIRRAAAGVGIAASRHNPSIPKRLETVVQKALSPNPRGRYQSAADFGRDLQRFLSDEPIRARRSGILERGILWSRREPRVALLTFASFALLGMLAIVSVIGYWQSAAALQVAETAQLSAQAALDVKTQALAAADAQRQRAEKNLQVAVTAFDQIMKNITDRGIEVDADVWGETSDTTAANVTPQDAKLLQALLVFFDELAANNSEQLAADAARAAQRAGEIYTSLGQLKKADEAFEDARQRYERWHELDAKNHECIVAWAEVMNEMAVIASLRGQIAYSKALFEETLQLLEGSEAAIASPEGRFQVARANRLFASLSSRSGLDGVQAKHPFARRLGAARFSPRTWQDLDAVEQAMNILNGLIDEFPDTIRYRAELARAYRNKAEVAARTRAGAEAEIAMRRAIELWEELLQQNDKSDAIRYELAMTLVSVEAIGFNQMQRALRAHELSQRLLASSPALPRYVALNARSLENLAMLKQKAGNLNAAADDYLQASRIYAYLAKSSPDISVYTTRQAQTLESLAEIKLRQQETEQARDYLELAIRQLQSLVRSDDMSPVGRIQLGRLKQLLKSLDSAEE